MKEQAKTKLTRASEIAEKVGQGMKTNNVFNLMRNRKPLRKVSKVKKADGRVFFKMRLQDIKTVGRLWHKMQERKKYLSTGDMVKWLISQDCLLCPEDLTKLARKGIVPATMIERFWGFDPEDKETILVKIKSRQADQA